jgi:isocitrate dehydrogenase (NAD+)
MRVLSNFVCSTCTGIGPEISQSIKDIYVAANVRAYTLRGYLETNRTQVPIQWEEVSVTPVLKGGKTVIPDAAIQSVKKNTVALKGKAARIYAIQCF